MANWNNPTLTSYYTNFVTEVKDRDTDCATLFDGSTSTNIPTGTKRWNATNNKFEKWSGTAWSDMATTYAISISGNAGSASHLSAGAAGSIPWQSAAGTTSYLAIGSANYVLTSDGSTPQWTANTGTGAVVRATSPTLATPTFTTSASGPLLIGGASATSTLTLRATSGVGTTGADIILQVGNNGATEAMRILNSGNVGIGTNNPAQKLDVNGDAVIYGVRVGRGAGAVSSNTAVGSSALNANVTGTDNVAVGYRAGYNSIGVGNTYIGDSAGFTNNTAGNTFNTFVGYFSGYYTTGSSNTFLGEESGNAITSGGKNTIIGRYSGNGDGLDIRTSSNYAVISDGDGNRLLSVYNGGTLALDGDAVPKAGTGITFPATQSASSDANTLDDYEEGTWTPTFTNLTVVGTPTYTGNYVKVGKQVTCTLNIKSTTSTASTANSTYCTGLPFTTSGFSVLSAVNHGNVTSYGNGSVQSNIAYMPTWSAVAEVDVVFTYFV